MKKRNYFCILLSVIMIMVTACCAFAQEEETTKEVKYKNGYPVVEIESPIHYNGAYNNDAKKLAKSHPFEDYQNYILFYGDSNFRLWRDTIENDFPEYRVIDHGFGGSTAVDLVHFANTLLFRYQSPIVILQNGLNDFGVLSGEDDSTRSDELIDYREEMLNAFHEIMPDTIFVFVSTLIVPGRTEFFDLAMDVNRRTKEMANQYDYLYFVDSTDLTYDGTEIHEDLFIEDGLHLTDEARTVWADQYIKPVIEQIITEYHFDSLRK